MDEMQAEFTAIIEYHNNFMGMIAPSEHEKKIQFRTDHDPLRDYKRARLRTERNEILSAERKRAEASK